MVNKRAWLFLISLLIFSYPVLALDVSGANFSWGGVPVEYFSSNVPLVVDLNFVLGVDSLDGVVLDVSDINNRFEMSSLTSGYGSVDIARAFCSSIEGGFSCVLRNLVLRKDSSDSTIVFKKGAVSESVIISLTESVDNPRVVFIGSEHCVEGVCFVRSARNNISIKFEGSQAGFNRGLIGARLGSESVSFRCEGSQCSGVATISCVDNQRLVATLTPVRGTPSRDDAGRNVINDNFEFICDSAPPEVLDHWAGTSRDIGVSLVSESFTVFANVSDSVSPFVFLDVDASSLNAGNVSGNCVNNGGGLFDCSASIQARVEARGTYDLNLTFSDAAGNKAFRILSVEISEVTDSVPDFWSVNSVKQSSNKFSVLNMGADRRALLEVDLNADEDVDLLRASVADFRCVPAVVNETGNAFDVTDLVMLKADYDGSKFFFEVNLRAAGISAKEENRYSDFSHLEYVCGLNLISKKDNYFYSSPQLLNFTIKFDLAREGRDLHKLVARETDNAVIRAENFQSRIDSIETTVDYLSFMCGLAGGLDVVKSGLGVTQTALELSGVGAGAAAAVQKGNKAVDKVSVSVNKFSASLCAFVSCEGVVSTAFNQYSGGSDSSSGVAQTTDSLSSRASDVMSDVSNMTGISQSTFWDPYKSRIVAYAKMCLPAILYHWKSDQAIECNYIHCLNEGVPNMGVSVSVCEAHYNYDQCLSSAGTWIYAIPFTSALADIAGTIADMFKDPGALLGGIVMFGCSIPGIENVPGLYPACIIGQGILTIPNHYAHITGIAEDFKNIAGNSNSDDRCSVVLRGYSATHRMNHELEGLVDGFLLQNQRQSGQEPAEVQEINIDENMNALCVGPNCDLFNSSGHLRGKVIVSPDLDGGNKSSMRLYDEAGTYRGDLNNVGGVEQSLLDLQGIRDMNRLRQNEIDKLDAQIDDLSSQLEILHAEDHRGWLEFNLGRAKSKKARLVDLDLNNRDNFSYFVSKFGNDEELSKLSDDISELASNAEKIQTRIDAENKYWSDLERDNPTLHRYLSLSDSARKERAKAASDVQFIDDATSEFTSMRPGDRVDRNKPLENVFNEGELNIMRGEFNVTGIKFKDNMTYRDAERALNDAKKDADISWGANFRLTLEELYGELMADLTNQFQSTSAVNRIRMGARGAPALADLVGWNYDTYRDTELGLFFEDLSEPERLWCDKIMGETPAVRDVGGGGGIVTRTGGGTTPGAYISVRGSSEQVLPDGSSYYQYWVSGGVEAEKSGLRFRVIAYDGGNRVHDYTEVVAREEAPVSLEGRVVSFGGLGRDSVIESENKYNRFCIDFGITSEGRRLSEYFHSVDVGVSMLCQRVVFEDSR